MASTVPMSAIERLKAAMNKSRMKKELLLTDGTVLELWFTRLTAAERDMAQKMADEASIDFAIQLVINKATDIAGNRLFNQGHVAELRNEVDFEDLQALELAILKGDGEKPLSMKSTEGGASA